MPGVCVYIHAPWGHTLFHWCCCEWLFCNVMLKVDGCFLNQKFISTVSCLHSVSDLFE